MASSDSDDEFPVLLKLAPPTKKKKEYTLADLKRFCSTADDCGRQLDEIKQSMDKRKSDEAAAAAAADQKLSEENRRFAEQTRETMERSNALFISTINVPYPGEGLIDIDHILAPNLKTSRNFVDEAKMFVTSSPDRGSAAMMTKYFPTAKTSSTGIDDRVFEALFNAVAFSVSQNELLENKAVLHRLISTVGAGWIPRLEQFWAVLETAFGAQLMQLIPPVNFETMLDRASKYVRQNFVLRVFRATDCWKVPLINLDAVMEMLSLLDWRFGEDNKHECAAWIRTILSLSLETQCRDRFNFRTSIGNILRRMAGAIVGGGEKWKQFSASIRTAVTYGGGELASWRPRHHRDMVELVCAVLPIDINRLMVLRITTAVDCLATLFRVEVEELNGVVVTNLETILERAIQSESEILTQGYPLSSVLALTQCALVPSGVRSARIAKVRRLIELLDSIGAGTWRQKYVDGGASTSTKTKQPCINMIDASIIRNMITLISAGQIKSHRHRSEFFQVLDTAIRIASGKGERLDATFELEDTAEEDEDEDEDGDGQEEEDEDSEGDYFNGPYDDEEEVKDEGDDLVLDE